MPQNQKKKTLSSISGEEISISRYKEIEINDCSNLVLTGDIDNGDKIELKESNIITFKGRIRLSEDLVISSSNWITFENSVTTDGEIKIENCDRESIEFVSNKDLDATSQ